MKISLSFEGRSEPVELEIGAPVAFSTADGSMVDASPLSDVADIIDYLTNNLPSFISAIQSIGPIASMLLPSPFNKLNDPKVMTTLVFLVQWLPALKAISDELRKVS